MLVLLGCLAVFLSAAVTTCLGQSPHVALDTLAARQLAVYAGIHTYIQAACVAAHQETSGGDSVWVVDSVTAIKPSCGDSVGVFINLPPESLQQGPDRNLWMLAEYAKKTGAPLACGIHGLVPIALPSGKWVRAPLSWCAYK